MIEERIIKPSLFKRVFRKEYDVKVELYVYDNEYIIPDDIPSRRVQWNAKCIEVPGMFKYNKLSNELTQDSRGKLDQFKSKLIEIPITELRVITDRLYPPKSAVHISFNYPPSVMTLVLPKKLYSIPKSVSYRNSGDGIVSIDLYDSTHSMHSTGINYEGFIGSNECVILRSSEESINEINRFMSSILSDIESKVKGSKFSRWQLKNLKPIIPIEYILYLSGIKHCGFESPASTGNGLFTKIDVMFQEESYSYPSGIEYSLEEHEVRVSSVCLLRYTPIDPNLVKINDEDSKDIDLFLNFLTGKSTLPKDILVNYNTSIEEIEDETLKPRDDSMDYEYVPILLKVPLDLYKIPEGLEFTESNGFAYVYPGFGMSYNKWNKNHKKDPLHYMDRIKIETFKLKFKKITD